MTQLGSHPSLAIGPLLETHKHDIGDILRESLSHEKKTLVEYEKLLELVRQREGVNFSPTGVLRLDLSEEEKDQMLEVVRRMLLQIRADS